MRKAWKGYLYIAPLVIGCLVFYLIPFVLVIQYSFCGGSGRSLHFVGMENYQKVVENETFQLAFGNTMRFLAVGLPLIMALSYLIALLLKSHAEQHKLFHDTKES